MAFAVIARRCESGDVAISFQITVALDKLFLYIV